MQTIIEVKINLYQGTPFAAEIECFTDSKLTTPFDFTGYDGIGGIFTAFGETAKQNLTVYFNLDPSDGVLGLSLSQVGVDALAVGDYVFDAVLWPDPGSDGEVFVRGTAHVHAKGSEKP